MMKVEIWSDYVCPFCYIGKRKFEHALEKFAHKDDIEVVFRSFELDPGARADSQVSTYDMLAKKYGMSIEQAKANTANIVEQGALVGIPFQFDGTVETNTFDAHRLVQYATEQGKGKELSERLFKAYFSEGQNVGNREILTALSAEVGLDAEETAEVLASSRYADVVRKEEEEGSRLGIRGVPFYVFDRKYAVSGAQATEVFMETLEKAWEEKHPSFIQVNGQSDDAVCTDGACVPKTSKE
ncbi:DSBA-like thioredoxin domain protein [compost metagenome]